MKVAGFREMSIWLWLRVRETNLLVLLLLLLAAILIYRIGFDIPVPAFDEEALRSLQVE